MKRSQKATVTLELHVHQATEQAILISDDGHKDRAQWLPLSLCGLHGPLQIGKTQKIDVIEILAAQKGLV
jgi:hypothetical protein